VCRSRFTLSRLSIRHADRLRADADRARTFDLLSSLRRALQSNLSRLKALSHEREQGAARPKKGWPNAEKKSRAK
jgi:hypothetical protein